MYRGEVGGDDLLGKVFVFDDIPDVPLHGLSGVQNSGLLILPVIGGLQEGICLCFQLLFPTTVPRLDALGQSLVFLLRLIDGSDILHVELVWVQVLQFDLATEQLAHSHLVIVGQEAFGVDLLIFLPGLFHLSPAFLHLGLGGRYGFLPGRLCRRLFICIALDISQPSQHVGDSHFKVMLCPPFEVLVSSIICVQAHLNFLETIHHFCNVLQLVRWVCMLFVVKEPRPVLS